MIAVLAAMWIPGSLIAWNKATGQNLLQSGPMLGVQKADPPKEFSIAAFVDSSFQRSVAGSVGPAIPFYETAVRAFNSAQYWLMGISTNKSIIVGRDRYLFPSYGPPGYCSRGARVGSPSVEKWLGQIKEINQRMTANGQAFIFLLTPSKSEIRPDLFPMGYPCRNPDHGKLRAQVFAELTAAGVPFVDGVSEVERDTENHGYDRFPQGAAHWTALSSNSTLRALVDRINSLFPARPLRQYDIDVSQAPVPEGDDRDHADLLNLTWPPLGYRTAHIEPKFTPPSSCPDPLHIGVVGGSFFAALGRGLAAAPCPPMISQLFYLVIGKREFGADTAKGYAWSAMDATILRTSPVVVMEENIDTFTLSSYVPATLEYLKTGKLPEAK